MAYRANLETLREFQRTEPDVEVYEVTQLINSMLGLLVFPQQRFYEHVPKIPLYELEDQGWPIPKVVGKYPQVRDLQELVRYLRNAVTHCNLEFEADSNEQIKDQRGHLSKKLRLRRVDHQRFQVITRLWRKTVRASLTTEYCTKPGMRANK